MRPQFWYTKHLVCPKFSSPTLITLKPVLFIRESWWYSTILGRKCPRHFFPKKLACWPQNVSSSLITLITKRANIYFTCLNEWCESLSHVLPGCMQDGSVLNSLRDFNIFWDLASMEFAISRILLSSWRKTNAANLKFYAVLLGFLKDISGELFLTKWWNLQISVGNEIYDNVLLDVCCTFQHSIFIAINFCSPTHTFTDRGLCCVVYFTFQSFWTTNVFLSFI